MKVKRYDPYYISDQGYKVGADMAIESLGDWVRADDYDALLALARRLRKSLTDEKAYGGGTVYCAETNETIFDSAWLEE